MKKEKLILEAGADGGSVHLFQINEYFLYATDESTLKDFVPDLTDEELKSKSDIFTSFAQAMESLIEKYPIFNLYPLHIHPDFKNVIIPFYQRFCSKNKRHENRKDGEWDHLLYYETK